METINDALVSKTILDARIDSYKKFMCFYLDDKSVVAIEATADCCSESWIEHMSGTEALRGKVLSFDMSKADASDDRETKWTFYALKTDKGTVSICMRNDSNGYYDGSLELSNKLSHEGEIKELRKNHSITEDF